MRKFRHIEDIQRRIFAAMLASLDESVGRVLRALETAGLERDTLVVFLSDNGGPTRELTSSNLPLRGGKSQLYEGGIRVPFMLSFPGRLSAGTYHKPVSAADLFATTLALAGADPDPRSDGVDLVPFLDGDNTGVPHRTLFWRQGDKSAVRVGDWKLVRHRVRRLSGPWELYNLRDDRVEQQDLASSQPQKLQELLAIWTGLNAQMVEPAFR